LTKSTIDVKLVSIVNKFGETMTMHLEGPWLSTTGKKKGKKKFASAEHARKAREQQESWKEFMKRWGIEEEERKRKRAMSSGTYTPPKVDPYRRETQHIESLPFTAGPCVKAPDKVYTGTMIKGIGTMHKSNAVPIFSDEQAVDIAKMRR
jgi:hypothetical protein